MTKGTNRNVESDEPASKNKQTNRVNDDEFFTRLFYIGVSNLNLRPDEFWLMPIGLILDLWECHRQYHGMSKPKIKKYIDEVIPSGI